MMKAPTEIDATMIMNVLGEELVLHGIGVKEFNDLETKASFYN